MEPNTRPEVYQEMLIRCQKAIHLRWVGLGVLFAIATVLATWVGYSLLPAILIAVFVGAYNLVGQLYVREFQHSNWALAPRGPQNLLEVLVLLDVVIIALCILASGGAASLFLPVYLVYLPLASLGLTRVRGILAGIIALILMNLVIWLPYLGILQPLFQTPDVQKILAGDFPFVFQQSLHHSSYLVLAVAISQAGIQQNQAILAQQRKLTEQTEAKARTDELTRLYNRRHFLHVLEEQVAIWICDRKPFSVLMTDLDHYKEYNDQYGHLAGDNALRELSEVVRAILRMDDMAFRYGGDELAIVLPGTSVHEAAAVAERVRRAVAAHSFATPEGSGTKITMSIGVAGFPADGRTIDGLISRADEALFSAKEERNAVRVAKTESNWYTPKTNRV